MSEQNHYIYEFGPFRLDAQKRLLLREGNPVKLFPKEFDTLLALVERCGEVLDKDELMRRVWGGVVVEESNLTTNISHLRKLLGEKPNQHQYIVTVPGQGYRFVAGVRAAFDEVIVHERTRVTIEQEEEVGEIEPIADKQLLPMQTNGGRACLDGTALATATSALPATTLDSNILVRSFKRHRVAIVIGSFFVLAAVATFFILSQHPRSEQQKAAPPIPFQQITIKRLAVNGNPLRCALSPDGKLFAYAPLDNEGRQTLWLGHVDGGEAVQLRPPAEIVYLSLTFAPDGSSLYFTVGEDYSDGALYKMPVFGGAAEKVKERVRNRITFSPDGKQFAFVRYNASGEFSLVIADTEGKTEREIVSRPIKLGFSLHSPSWSPDGSMIAVGATKNESGEESEIFIVSVADGSIKPLTAMNWKAVRMTEWLNDSSGLIAIASDKNPDRGLQLWHVSYPEGEARRIVADLNTYGHSIGLSADNNSLLSIHLQHQSNIWIAPADDLSNAKQITFDLLGRQNGWYGLDWTPDGRVVFTASVDQNQTIWTMDADGSNKKQLLPSGYRNDVPSVTNDGRYIVFQSDRSGSFEIWRVRLDGTDLKQLTTGGNNWAPHVTLDGKWVVYVSSREDLYALWRVSIDGGEPVRLTEKAASWPRVSPDGKLIACAYDDGKPKLAILPVEGGQPIKLFDVPRLANFGNSIRWTPDGKAVTYRDWANGIWKQTLDGGEPRRLEGLPQEKLYPYGWSRDGKLFAFTRGMEMRDIVLIRDVR